MTAYQNESSLNSTLDTVHLSHLSIEENDPLLVEARQLIHESASSAQQQEATTISSTTRQGTDESSSQRPDFTMGDHVYMWCSFAGIPNVYQHHGIVLDVYYSERRWVLKIADFSNFGDDEKVEPKKKSLRGSISSGCIRTYEVTDDDHYQWHKVEYQAPFWHRHLHRSGTCTAAECDPPGLVRARVQFLMDHPEVLPQYSAIQANCECIAVWAKCGTVGTLQAMSWLHLTAAGQVKSAATLATAVASTQVTVPAAGLWGWLGYTTHVSLASTQPLLLPAIAAYGAVTVGLPAITLLRAKQKWKGLTEKLNTAFWESAMAHPDVFVECITEWSLQE